MRTCLCRRLGILLLAMCVPVSALARDDDEDDDHRRPRIVVDDDGQAQFGNCSGSAPALRFIQAAIDAAPAGAIIHVCSGVYEEQLKITKSLTLVGRPEGDEARAVVFPNGLLPNLADIADASPIAAAIAVEQAVDVTIRNLTVDVSRNGLSDCNAWLVGIGYSQSSGRVQHVSVTGARYGAGLELCENGAGILVQGGALADAGAVVEILENHVRDFQYDGIRGDESGARIYALGNIIDGGRPTSVPTAGMSINFGGSGFLRGNQITNLTNMRCVDPDNCDAVSAFGIYIEAAASNIRIQDNVITHTQDGVVAFDTPRIRITDNRMASIGTFGGVFLSALSSGGVVRGNRVSAALFGVQTDADGSVIHENELVNLDAGIVIFAPNVIAHQNTVNVANFGVVISSDQVDSAHLKQNSFINVGAKTLVVPPPAAIQTLAATEGASVRAPTRRNR